MGVKFVISHTIFVRQLEIDIIVMVTKMWQKTAVLNVKSHGSLFYFHDFRFVDHFTFPDPATPIGGKRDVYRM